MCKEFLSLHIGQAGVQSSHALWELLCIEHGIGSDGILRNKNDESYTGENIEAMYYEIKNSRFVPRAILIDLEPTVVDEVRRGSYRDMWNPSNIINQKEDAASNYARGYYTSGKTFLPVAIERINRELERCDNLSAFEIVHSFAGGTGSGFTALMYETINQLYGKKFKFSLGVFPSPTISEIMVETYNSVLHTSATLETQDCVVIFDNESLFKKSVQKLNVSQPTFSLMNRLISQMFSSISLSHRYRFFGSQHADVTELLTNLVPYPRIHFPIMSYSPLISFTQQRHEQFNCSRLTNDVFHEESHVLQCAMRENKFMSCCMLYRGTVSPKPIIDAIAKIKSSRNINFVDWCPTGFKIGINTCPPIQIPHCEQAIGDNAVCMISGNTAVRKCWGGIVNKFDMLMSKRAFVHWYVAEGLEEGEFLDSRDNIQTLILDYDELASQSIEERSDSTVNPKYNPQTNNAYITASNSIRSHKLKSTTMSSETKKSFRSQCNPSCIIENNEELKSLNESRQDKTLYSCKLGKINKNICRQRQPIHSSDQINSTENVKIMVTKCNEAISNSIKAINRRGRNERDRHITKNLDVKEIGKTVAKYLCRNEKSKNRNFTYPKKTRIPLTRHKSLKDSTINLSQSYTSSQSEFLEKYDMMRNNNKGKSLQNSSSTGSFKSALEVPNKMTKSFIRKSQSRWRVVDQLLYNNNDLGNNHENMNKVELNTSLSSVDKVNLACKRYSSIEILPREEKVICLLEKPLKPSTSFVDIDTKISQNFKKRNLDLSILETVSCEPVYITEI